MDATKYAEAMYTATTGCTTYVNGERGTTTAIARGIGAFVLLAERDAMVYVELGDITGPRHHEVLSAREIDREEFDRLNGLDTLRKDMGWAL